MTSLSQKALDLLGRVDLFASLGKSDLAGVGSLASTQKHSPAKIVFRQGDKSDSFHIVLAGKFDCYLWDDLLKIERPLRSLGSGEVFGEIGLLTGENRSAFVRAQEESETIVFEKKAFIEFLEENPKILLAFSRILA